LLTLLLLLLLLLLCRFANGATKRAYFDYIRAYDWPTGRRLADGSTEPHGVADDWTVPEGWDLSAGDWKEGFVPTAESFTVGTCNHPCLVFLTAVYSLQLLLQ
jgi:hypothetical protein